MNKENPPPDKVPQEAFDALETLYQDLATRIAIHEPPCQARGLCCDFHRSDHRLYASTLELLFARRSSGKACQEDPALCLYFDGTLCHAREGRPLGCRLYFCDPRWQDEMERLSEEFHQRMRKLHDDFEIPYSYGEFVTQIRAD